MSNSGSEATPSDGPKNRLEEQATSKADLSYSYWAKGTAERPTAVSAPKKLTDEEAAVQQTVERKQSQKGASAWNHADTFEERNVTSYAKEQLEQLLTGLEAVSGGLQLKVTGAEKCEGEAHVWYVRGKKRVGYEFDATIQWEGTDVEGSQVSGTFRLPNLCPDDLDELELEGVTCSKDAAQQAAVAAAKQLLQQVQQQLEGLQELLKAK